MKSITRRMAELDVVDEAFMIADGRQFDRLVYAFISACEKIYSFLCAKILTNGPINCVQVGGAFASPPPPRPARGRLAAPQAASSTTNFPTDWSID
jgi:hypothetical protein